MASMAMYAVQTVSGNQPHVRQIIEDVGQTYLFGTPVMLHSTNGAVKVWDGSTIPGIVGIVRINGQNLVTAGVANPLHYGSVPNQSAALNIPVGQPLAYGKALFETTSIDSIFIGQVGPSQTALATDVGVQYGMTLDSDGHWYVDKTKTTTSAVVTIVNLNPYDPRGVYYQFIPGQVVNVN